MNYFELHIGDLVRATVHLSMCEDGALNRLLRKYYETERPLPVDVARVQRLVGARSKRERDAVESVLSEFFELQTDGWHQSRCDAEIAVYREKQADLEGAKGGAKERQRRARERRKALFEALRGYGVVPAYSATTSELEAQLSRVTSGDSSRAVTPHVTRDDTATQTPDTRHQSPNKEKERGPSTAVARPVDPPSVGPDPGSDGGSPMPSPTPAGEVCRAMRSQGLASVNSGDPRLLALLAQGATVAEFEGLAAEAVAGGKGFAWVMAALAGRRSEAAAIVLAPAAQSAASSRSRIAETQALLAQQRLDAAAATPMPEHLKRRRTTA